eukprot:TRINITY_DN9730_c0_g1_i1.p7 TRINITY_DN9730_c0_g1~~TRINITY_DN9730_c0_g1_i1.p7  ORF type:complete len:101 (+),score=6.39 TRINITY_DN9730_c0_g1_i1:103-405(+)
MSPSFTQYWNKLFHTVVQFVSQHLHFVADCLGPEFYRWLQWTIMDILLLLVVEELSDWLRKFHNFFNGWTAQPKKQKQSQTSVTTCSANVEEITLENPVA